MAIDDELSPLPSVTEGGRALQFFTDRYEFTRLFAIALNQDPPRQQILFFHGDGGNGKSLLLKFLRQRCCKRLSRSLWQQVQGRSDADLANYIEKLQPNECEGIPAALLDFGMQPIGNNQPQHPFYGLLMLRRNLAESAAELRYRLRFPLYDFACIWYLHKKESRRRKSKRCFR
ncbi:MAG: hypothetical protein HC772_17470 [Leptolyngbyaceae cyanobacterium CRU_2_3]|nr:hypothetical protein [Leptolyngbyaceae cyanobacterium CRU_2_3]